MIQSELEHHSGITLVACDEKSGVVGWCCARFVMKEVELLKIVVSQQQRRRGIGRLLLLTLVQFCSTNGYSTIHLEVRQSNRDGCEFYRKCGFSQTGMRRKYYTNPSDNAILMMREIDTLQQS